MTFPTEIFYYLIAGIVVLLGLTLTSEGVRRRRLTDVLLVVLTVFIGLFLYHAFSTNKLGRTNGGVAADQAEMQLRLVEMFKSFQDRLAGAAAGSGSDMLKNIKDDQGHKMQVDSIERAEQALRTAIKQDPESVVLRTKLVVLLETTTKKSDADPLIAQLAEAPKKQKESLGPAISTVLSQTYTLKSVPASDVSKNEELIKQVLNPGWYRDQALLRMLQVAPDKKLYQQTLDAIQERNMISCAKLMMVLLFGLGSALLGCLVLLWQAFTVARTEPKKPDEVGLQVPLRTVYLVFAGWFAAELVVSFAYHWLQKEYPVTSTQPLTIASTTALTYILSNFTAPLLIWLVAFKPNNWHFFNSLRFVDRTSTAGKYKLILCGFLGWCAALPVVAGTAFVAQRFLHSTGSDNPVLGQILQAASGSSILATVIFYLTLGVLAPLFEETLFRGFIYASLKPKIGTFFSIVASGGLFALMHFDKGGMLMLFAIGVVLAYLFERTRSLMPSMICHGLWNSGTFTLALLIFG